jgi:probable phosphoglycerate mutase
VIELVRHGRTEANASGLLLGRADPSLDASGRAQAVQLADVLVGEPLPVEAIVTSPLARARETAETISAKVGVQVEVDERLVEIDYGEWDGRPFGQVPDDVATAWRTDPTFAAPGGESLAAVGARVERCLADLLARAAGGRIVAVSHVSPIKAAVVRALGLDDDRLAWRMRLDLASITRIVDGPAGPVLLTFNETGHLR